MANPLLTTRVPPYIISFIEDLASKTNRTKTDVVNYLIESSVEFQKYDKEQNISEKKPNHIEYDFNIQSELNTLKEFYKKLHNFLIISEAFKAIFLCCIFIYIILIY